MNNGSPLIQAMRRARKWGIEKTSPCLHARRKGVYTLLAVSLALLCIDAIFLFPLAKDIVDIENSITAQKGLAERYSRKIEQTEARLRKLEATSSADSVVKEQLARFARYATDDAAIEDTATRFDAGLTRLSPGNLRKLSYRPRQDAQEGDIVLATFEYELAGTIQGLAALLDKLHTAEAPFLIRELCITTTTHNRTLPLHLRLQLGLISDLGQSIQP